MSRSWIILTSQEDETEEGISETSDVVRQDLKANGPALVFDDVQDAKRVAIQITLKAICGFEKTKPEWTSRLQALMDKQDLDGALKFIQKLAIKRLKQVSDVLTSCELIPLVSFTKSPSSKTDSWSRASLKENNNPWSCSMEDRLDV